MIHLLKTLFILLLIPSLCWAAPVVTGPASASHGATMTVTGSGFGNKSPAAPLKWDDGEARTINSPSEVTGAGGWSQAGPSTQTYAKTDAYIQYRDSTFRSMTAPHSKSTKWLSGGHYQWCIGSGDESGCTGDNAPIPYSNGGQTRYDNVYVHIDSGVADKSHWFVSFYYRTDANHPIKINGANHKLDVINKGETFYSGEGFTYSGFTGAYSPWATDGDCVSSSAHGISGVPPCTAMQPKGNEVDNAKLDWVKMEHRSYSNASGGQREIKVNNVMSDHFVNEADCANWFNNSRSFTVGGYYRWSVGSLLDNADFRGERNAYRYFDDIYIDTTWSRVMLCNNATYANATICEPQIPSAWADGSITATTNLGDLSGATAYLFVFDSTNIANGTGYPVTLGDTPTSVQGLTIQGR